VTPLGCGRCTAGAWICLLTTTPISSEFTSFSHRSNHKSVTLQRVVKEGELASLLPQSSTDLIEAVNISGEESSSEDSKSENPTADENATEDVEHLPSQSQQDIEAYKARCNADINHQYTTLVKLQRCAASQMIGMASSATLVCPLYRDIFDAAYVVYRFYEHLEDPVH
jgi:hypothetical protein